MWVPARSMQRRLRRTDLCLHPGGPRLRETRRVMLIRPPRTQTPHLTRRNAVAYVIDPNAVEVRLAVTVYVNPADETLLDVIKDSHGAHSIRDIVRGEIES